MSEGQDPPAPVRCRVDGEDSTLLIGDEGIEAGLRVIPWHAVDTMADAGSSIVIGTAQGTDPAVTAITISHLGAGRDTVARDMRERRNRSRRPAMGVGDLASEDSYEARDSNVVTGGAGAVTYIDLTANGAVLERGGDVARFLPWGLVEGVERSGYLISFPLRWGDPAQISGLGRRTDEFLDDVDRLRRDLSRATGEAAAQLGAGGVPMEDGWAVSEPPVVSAWLEAAGETESGVLREVCGEWRAGLFLEGAVAPVPFLIGRTSSDATIVEGVGTEDRATFVFDSPDTDRVNAALLLSSFRRELLFWPDDRLGPWTAAIRTQPEVRWLRSALKARVVHDERWADRLRSVSQGAGA